MLVQPPQMVELNPWVNGFDPLLISVLVTFSKLNKQLLCQAGDANLCLGPFSLQKLEHLLQGCQGACAFLQGAIHKVEPGKLPDRAEVSVPRPVSEVAGDRRKQEAG